MLQGNAQAASPRTLSSKGITLRFRHNWIQMPALLLPCWGRLNKLFHLSELQFFDTENMGQNSYSSGLLWGCDRSMCSGDHTWTVPCSHFVVIWSHDILSFLLRVISPPWEVLAANFSQHQGGRLMESSLGWIQCEEGSMGTSLQQEDKRGCLWETRKYIQPTSWNLVGIWSPSPCPALGTSPGIHFLVLNSLLILSLVLYFHTYQGAQCTSSPLLELQGPPLPLECYPSYSLLSFCHSPHFQGNEQFPLWASAYPSFWVFFRQNPYTHQLFPINGFNYSSPSTVFAFFSWTPFFSLPCPSSLIICSKSCLISRSYWCRDAIFTQNSVLWSCVYTAHTHAYWNLAWTSCFGHDTPYSRFQTHPIPPP